MYCGYELKTGSAGGWTGAWETAATEISGKGLEAPGRSTSYERCGFCVQSAGRAGLTGEGRYLQQKLHSSLQALERQREAGGGWVQQERGSQAETRGGGGGVGGGGWGTTGESKPGRNKT